MVSPGFYRISVEFVQSGWPSFQYGSCLFKTRLHGRLTEKKSHLPRTIFWSTSLFSKERGLNLNISRLNFDFQGFFLFLKDKVMQFGPCVQFSCDILAMTFSGIHLLNSNFMTFILLNYTNVAEGRECKLYFGVFSMTIVNPTVESQMKQWYKKHTDIVKTLSNTCLWWRR